MKLDFYHNVSYVRHKKALALSNFTEETADVIFLFTNSLDTKNI